MENLNQHDVIELHENEMRNTNGGLWALLLALTAMGINDSIEHPEAFLKGLMGEDL